jgi:hypothetical protein
MKVLPLLCTPALFAAAPTVQEAKNFLDQPRNNGSTNRIAASRRLVNVNRGLKLLLHPIDNPLSSLLIKIDTLFVLLLPGSKF